jgi:hypothetical protein
MSDVAESLTTALAMSIAYAPESDKDIVHFADLSEKAVDMMTNCLLPGAQAVNALPIRMLLMFRVSGTSDLSQSSIYPNGFQGLASKPWHEKHAK